MSLHNIATAKHKCAIIKASSCQNEILHPPTSIISEDAGNLWISGEGLPQEIIMSLELVDFNYQLITTIAIVCAHDYETNPKVIQIWTSKDRECAQNAQYVYWDKMELKKKRGKQIFSISEIPESERIIKLIITETYGEYHTYLNQVMLLAEPDHQTSQSLYNHEEWLKISDSRAKAQSKNRKTIKNEVISNAKSSRVNQQSPLQFLRDAEESEEDKKIKRQKSLDLRDIQERSFERNAAILAMSKNLVIMEDNVEELSRKVEVLQKRVEYTYQNLESSMMKRIQDVINKKIQMKIQAQLNRREINQPPRRLKSCKDLATSRTMQQGSKEKEKKVMSLVAQLNDKLKQRSKLASKLQKRLKIKAKPLSQYYD